MVAWRHLTLIIFPSWAYPSLHSGNLSLSCLSAHSLVDVFMLSDGKFNRIFCHRFGHTREREREWGSRWKAIKSCSLNMREKRVIMNMKISLSFHAWCEYLMRILESAFDFSHKFFPCCIKKALHAVLLEKRMEINYRENAVNVNFFL